MGCFDTLVVFCIFCNAENYEQTKSGPCMLDYYRWDQPDLPTWMMQEFNGCEVQCSECDRTFRIVYDYEVVVKDRRLEAVNNLDYLELKDKEKNG